MNLNPLISLKNIGNATLVVPFLFYEEPTISKNRTHEDEDKDNISPYYFKDKMNCIFKDSENRNVLQWSIVENNDDDTEIE